MTDLQDLGYHPAYQPGPGETYYDYTHPDDRRPYTRGENIAGALFLATAVAPGLVAGTVGMYARVVWSLSRSALGRVVFAGPVAQYGKVKALDTYINRADLIYTTYQFMQHRDRFRESPGNSSQVLPAGSARPGGTKNIREPHYIIPQHGYRKKAGTRGPCDPGYVLKKVDGWWVCVTRESWNRSRSR